jgi:hypothetical protein
MELKMGPSGENFLLPTIGVSWLQRDLLLFAVSIGITTDELNFVFVSSSQGAIRVYTKPNRSKAVASKPFQRTLLCYIYLTLYIN